MEEIAIYIHIPFCLSRCSYCDFYTLTTSKDRENYADSIILEIEKYASLLKQKLIKSIYFGGGTPTSLPALEIIKILNFLKTEFKIKNGAEIALEANPNSVDFTYLTQIYNAGFNRISFGMQSAIEEENKILGRTHSLSDVEEAVKHAKNAGFLDISLDLMIGIPNQTKVSLLKSLDFILSQNVTHVSVYMLQLEKNTPLFKMQNSLDIPDDETVADFYKIVVDFLLENEFFQYEISNFAKKSFPSKHNLAYWDGSQYLGFGPSAASFLNAERFKYSESLDDFMENSFISNEIITEAKEEVDEYANFLMLALRLNKGILFSEAEEKFSQRFKENKASIIRNSEALSEHGLVNLSEDGVFLTTDGFLLSNSVTLKILEDIL